MDESLIDQLKIDLKDLFDECNEYNNMLVKTSYEEFPEITYPCVIIEELENSDNTRFYNGKENVVDVGYQFTIYADQTETKDAVLNVRTIINIIKEYMRGDRYHALQRMGPTPITKSLTDENIRLGYMRYIGCIDINTNTIYRRN